MTSGRHTARAAFVWKLVTAVLALTMIGALVAAYLARSATPTVTHVAAPLLEMVSVDRQGHVTGSIGAPDNYRGIDLSPDGGSMAAHRDDGQGGDIWVTDLLRGTTSRFTYDSSRDNSSPIWSPSGSRIVFGSIRGGKGGLYAKRSDGNGPEERLFESDGMMTQIVPTTWSPDGRSIAYETWDPGMQRDLWLLTLAGDGRGSRALVRTRFNEDHGQISPDGNWLAYQSDETGEYRVYVQPFPTGAGRLQVSVNRGTGPRWNGNGRELFYISGLFSGTLMVVRVNADGSIGEPKELFDAGTVNVPHLGGSYHNYAVSADGQHFVFSRPVKK